MSYDKTSYFERRNEARLERLNEESYQRSLARARSGEMALASREGAEAVGLGSGGGGQSLAAGRSLASNYAGGVVGAMKIRSGNADLRDAGGAGGAGDSYEGGAKTFDLSGNPGYEPTYQGGAKFYDLTPPPEPAPGPHTSSVLERAPHGVLDDTPESRADGGLVKAGRPYRVGERRSERYVSDDGEVEFNVGQGTFVPQRSGIIYPGNLTKAQRKYFRENRSITSPEAQVYHADTQAGSSKYSADTHERTGKYTADSHIASAKVQAEPNRMLAEEQVNDARLKRRKQFNEDRDTEYDAIIGKIDAQWAQTVTNAAARFRSETGRDMDPDNLAALRAANPEQKVAIIKELKTPEYKELLAMGAPKEGEKVRPGLLVAHGYKPKEDGSWEKEDRGKVDRYVPTAEGLTRRQEASRYAGPAVYRQGDEWYGIKSDQPLQAPPKVIAMKDAISPKVINGYNQQAVRHGLPKVDQELVNKNPGAAAWIVLTGLNKINQGVGAHAPLYTLNEADTKIAIAGDKDWRNLRTPAPTAPAGTPPSLTPEAIKSQQAVPGNIDLNNRPILKNPDGSFSTVSSMSFNIDGKDVLLPTISNDGRRMTPEEAVKQYRTTGQHLGKFNTPEEATAYAQQLHKDQEAMYKVRAEQGAAEADPAMQNYKALYNAVAPVAQKAVGVAGGVVDYMTQPFRRAGEGLGSLAVQAARQTIPGAYKIFQAPTPENPLGLEGYKSVDSQTPNLAKLQLPTNVETTPGAWSGADETPNLAAALPVVSKFVDNAKVAWPPGAGPGWAPEANVPQTTEMNGGVRVHTPVREKAISFPGSPDRFRAYGSTEEAAADQAAQERAGLLQTIRSPY